MPTFQAEEHHADLVRETFATYEGLDHLRVRRRGNLVTVESGPTQDPIPHARFRRVAVHIWVLEMATPTARWQPTGMRDQLKALLDALINDFGWTLTRIV